MNSSQWLISNTDIRPGATAVLGGNIVAFLVIHIISICLNIISIICCVVIVTHILWSQRKQGLLKMEISSRFQIYFGIGDIIFAIAFTFEHSYLLATQTLLETKTAQTILSVLITVPFAWTHFFRCSVSIFAYLNIVKDVRVSLGYWEWKVHLGVLLSTSLMTATYIYFDMFGNNGYWSSFDVSTRNGLIGASIVSFILFCIATIYLFSFWSIKRRVVLARNRLRNIHQSRRNQEAFKKETTKQQNAVNRHIGTNKYHPTILKCLTTHVRIGMWIYCPLAIFIGGQTFIQFAFGVTSTILSGLIVIVANSNGWANALGYFYNERIKKNHKRNLMNTTIKIDLSSSAYK